MKVVVDNKIPFIRGVIEQVAGTVEYAAGQAITPEMVKDADALIIRTRTRCDRTLLENSRVQFIGTATIGFDHLDTAYLAERGIAWCNCPGCNASSVAQYLRSVLLLLKREKGVNLQAATLGIVGVGHVGTCVEQMARELGMRVLLNDPPRAEQDPAPFVSLREIQEQADFITFHTPLVREGRYPTCHLADAAFFRHLVRTPYIINTSRGEVVDNRALLHALEEGTVRDAVVDTWENEPEILRPLLERVYIGTPHIAGYSADGKANATRMVLEAFCRHFGLDCPFEIVPPELPEGFGEGLEGEELQLQLYNPLIDSIRLKEAPEKFEEWRGNYPLRRENLHKKR